MKTFMQKNLRAGIWLLCFIILPGFAAYAETDNGSITGIIVNDSTSTPVSFASVALLNATDSSLLTGVITDSYCRCCLSLVPCPSSLYFRCLTNS
jgi:hypothetical protein